ncbi:hypothetical protein SASPL_143158 [Salvia splendens]|uniref:Uncharacterized protein n=1 Tax=Salvia splendens TaxID=180675 RepID=A0A8X8WL97_SALSN|nr:hypothetical protein SASPL_143158 [Salvia splendens]
MFSNLDFMPFMFGSSDLQLAIALQQQEFEQQQPQRSVHPTVASDSGLAVDPQFSHKDPYANGFLRILTSRIDATCYHASPAFFSYASLCCLHYAGSPGPPLASVLQLLAVQPLEQVREEFEVLCTESEGGFVWRQGPGACEEPILAVSRCRNHQA